jgi:uncharacterized protein (TIGR00251 family)
VSWYAWQDDRLLLRLRVQPRAKQPGVDGVHGERLRVRIGAPPVDDRANAELVGLLATAFDLPRRAVAITQGEHGQAKTVTLTAPRTLPDWFTRLAAPCPDLPPSLDSRPRRSV